MKTPFARSYWIIPDRFLAGCYPGALEAAVAEARATGLVQAGITLCVSLMEPTELDHSGKPFTDYSPQVHRAALRLGREVGFLRLPIVDGGIPTPDLMRRTLDAIDAELAAGGRVYLHCWGGRGRTGTVVGCWLMRHGRADRANVLEAISGLIDPVKDLFVPSPETDLQRRFLVEGSAV